MRGSVVVLAVLVACPGCITYRTDEIKDEEIQAKKKWTPRDAEARGLLRAEPRPMFGEFDSEKPIRRPTVERKFYDELAVGPVIIPIPRPSRGIGFFLGLEPDPRYYFCHGTKKYIFLRRDAPPVIVDEEGAEEPGGGQLPGSKSDVPQRDVEATERLLPRIQLPEPIEGTRPGRP